MELPEFRIHEEDDGARVLLSVRGEIDMATVGGVRLAIEGAAARGGGDVWLDLTEVDFMDSTGLTALVAGYQALDGRRFAIICPSEGPVYRALEVSGLSELLPVYPSRKDADAA
jgi:anti-sigma B factor antagonist